MNRADKKLAKEALRAFSGESRVMFNLSIFKNRIMMWVDNRGASLIRSKHTPDFIKKILGGYFLRMFIKNQEACHKKNLS